MELLGLSSRQRTFSPFKEMNDRTNDYRPLHTGAPLPFRAGATDSEPARQNCWLLIFTDPKGSPKVPLRTPKGARGATFQGPKGSGVFAAESQGTVLRSAGTIKSI